METHLSHVQFNVSKANLQFYRDFMICLGWPIIYDSPEMVGALGKRGESMWFSVAANDVSIDRDARGMNHIGISAPSQADVDEVCTYLKGKGVQMLYGTPQHRPDFAAGEDQTYYQIMFDSPDRILWEVVYSGPKGK